MGAKACYAHARTVTAYRPTCDCALVGWHDRDPDRSDVEVPTQRCVVLDPFSGTGTTGVVALREGCGYVGIDASPEYTEMARKRLDAAQTGVSEAEAAAGQQALFAEPQGRH